MFDYRDLIGRPYVEGATDCYGLMREYFARAWEIELPNLARPHRFWEDPHLDLYGQYAHWGFRPIFDQRFQIGDVLLMPIMTPMNSHAAAIVDDNKILHHLPDQLSRVDPLRPKWSNRSTVALRHPSITDRLIQTETVTSVEKLIDAPVLRNRAVQEHLAGTVEERG